MRRNSFAIVAAGVISAAFVVGSPAMASAAAPTTNPAGASTVPGMQPWTKTGSLPASSFSLSPQIKELGDGRLLSVWRTGDGDVPWRINSAYSTDQGKTWSAPTTLVNSAFETSSRIKDLYEPAITVAGQRIVISYATVDSGTPAWRMCAIVSNNAGQAWSNPQDLSGPMHHEAVFEVPKTTVSPQGTISIGWRFWDNDAGTFTPQVRQLRAGQATWSQAKAPYQPKAEDDQSLAMKISANSDDSVAVMWVRDVDNTGESGLVQTATLSPKGAFGSVFSAGMTNLTPELVSDTKGNSVAAFVVVEGDRAHTLRSVVYDAKTKTWANRDLADWSEQDGIPKLLATKNGLLRLFAVTHNESSNSIRESIGTAKDGFGLFRQVAAVPGSCQEVNANEDRKGEITIAWVSTGHEGTAGLNTVTSKRNGEAWQRVVQVPGVDLNRDVRNVAIADIGNRSGLAWVECELKGNVKAEAATGSKAPSTLGGTSPLSDRDFGDTTINTAVQPQQPLR